LTGRRDKSARYVFRASRRRFCSCGVAAYPDDLGCTGLQAVVPPANHDPLTRRGCRSGRPFPVIDRSDADQWPDSKIMWDGFLLSSHNALYISRLPMLFMITLVSFCLCLLIPHDKYYMAITVCLSAITIRLFHQSRDTSTSFHFASFSSVSISAHWFGRYFVVSRALLMMVCKALYFTLARAKLFIPLLPCLHSSSRLFYAVTSP